MVAVTWGDQGVPGREGNALEIVVQAHDGYYFAGPCGTAQLSVPLHAVVGGDFDEVLSALVGTTTWEQVEELIEPAAVVDTNGQAQIPSLTDDVARQLGLTSATLIVEVADSEPPDLELCTMVGSALNECLYLRGEFAARPTLQAWLSPKEPLTFVSVDPGTGKIKTVAAIDVSDALLRDLGSASGGFWQVRIDMRASSVEGGQALSSQEIDADPLLLGELEGARSSAPAVTEHPVFGPQG